MITKPKYEIIATYGNITNYHYVDTQIEMMNIIKPLFGGEFTIEVKLSE